MSYIPFLRQPPTQPGTILPPNRQSSTTSSDDLSPTTAPVKTNSNSDPFGPRQWSSSLVKLSGKNRALNEFSVERLGEENEQNLVMLHGIHSPSA